MDSDTVRYVRDLLLKGDVAAAIRICTADIQSGQESEEVRYFDESFQAMSTAPCQIDPELGQQRNNDWEPGER